MEKISEQVVDTYEEIVWTVESCDESRSSHGENSTQFKRKRSGDDDDASPESENEASSSEKLNHNWSEEVSRESEKLKKKIRKLRCSTMEESHKIAIAEPLIRCVWTGNFEVLHEQAEFNRGRYYRLNAFLSSKACDRARRTADRLDSDLEFVVAPRDSLWPESFPRSGPTDDAIALFLFPPSPEHEKAYDSLVNEMIRDDLAMKACVPHPDLPITRCADLLIFTSVELPWACRRYQRKFYLWGVFRRCKDIFYA